MFEANVLLTCPDNRSAAAFAAQQIKHTICGDFTCGKSVRREVMPIA